MKKKNKALLFISLSAVCAIFLCGKIAWADDPRTGFYAGPLSVAAVTFSEEAKSTSSRVGNSEVSITKTRGSEPPNNSAQTKPSHSRSFRSEEESPLSVASPRITD